MYGNLPYAHLYSPDGSLMATTSKTDRIEFRLPAHVKKIIEQAAAHTGQSLTDFAVSTLLPKAEALIQQQERTILTRRDRELFLRMLDETSPNQALQDAAESYKKQAGAE